MRTTRLLIGACLLTLLLCPLASQAMKLTFPPGVSSFIDSGGVVHYPDANNQVDIGSADQTPYLHAGFKEANPDVSPVFNVLAFGADPTGVLDSHTAIVSAQAQAALACGTVLYPGGTFKNLSSVTLAPCVTHQGVGYQLKQDSTFTLAGGTILLGNGTDAMFVYQPTDGSGQPASIPIVFSTLLSGASVQSMGIKNVTYGIKCGARYVTGCSNSIFEHLFIENPSQWGMYLENSGLNYVSDISVSGFVSGAVGSMYFGASQTVYNWSNITFRGLRSYYPLYGSRGIVFQGRDGAVNNQLDADHILSLMSSVKVTQSATTDGANPSNLTVSDGTKFPKDMPVTVAASAGGLVANQVYFVTSQSGNVLQIANKQRGTPLQVTATVSLVCYGFPAVEIVAHSDINANAVIQGSTFSGMDLEGTATTFLLAQNANVYLDIDFIAGGQGTVDAVGLVTRNTFGTWRSAQPISIDLDSASGNLNTLGMQSRPGETSFVQKPPLGIFYDAGLGGNVFNIQDGHNGKKYTFIPSFGSNFSEMWIYPAVALGQRIGTSSQTTITLDTQYAGALSYTGTTSTTWTLPAITGTSGGASTSSTAGQIFCVTNGSTTGGVVLTLSSGSSNFNRQAAKTSYTMALGKSMCVVGQWDGSAGFWQVMSNDGAT